MPHDIAREVEKIAEELGVDRKRSIGEVAQELKVKPHVIRFWEDNFSQIKPEVGAGGRRYYYNKQLKILRRIKKFLYEDGYTIAGLKKLLSGKKSVDQEEDLQILMNEDNGLDLEPATSQRRIEIDDFLPSEPRIERDLEIEKPEVAPKKNRIDPTDKLMDFATLEILAIDPRIKNKILKHAENAQMNLEKLKKFLK